MPRNTLSRFVADVKSSSDPSKYPSQDHHHPSRMTYCLLAQFRWLGVDLLAPSAPRQHTVLATSARLSSRRRAPPA